jgi:tripartite-type tricarboxylate transporter receptor subunit TctC
VESNSFAIWSDRMVSNIALSGIAIAAALFAGQAVEAAERRYPWKPLRIVVPYAAGGGGDALARVLSPQLNQRLGQFVIADNRPGAGTIIGTDLVAKAAPDGHTLLINTSAFTINPSLQGDLPYDTLRDFVAVQKLVSLPNVLVVHPSIPATSVKELIAYAKSKPGLTYASSGTGTGAHLAGELFRSMAGLDLVHIPYKGGGAVMPDVIAGRVDMSFATLPSALPHVQSGKLRALGLASKSRSPTLPNLPTIAEAGLPGYDASNWIGLFAPAKTPRPIVELLDSTFRDVIQNPEMKAKLLSLGFEPDGSGTREFTAVVADEIAKWRKLIVRSGATAR